MWIFLNDAFLSIVEERDDYRLLRVRARIGEDIARVFPDAKVRERGRLDADYRYVALIDRDTVVKTIASEVSRIDYRNFKGSVSETARHDAYLRVWGVMVDEQERRRPLPEPKAARKPGRKPRRAKASTLPWGTPPGSAPPPYAGSDPGYQERKRKPARRARVSDAEAHGFVESGDGGYER
jgi:hypothetical protein